MYYDHVAYGATHRYTVGSVTITLLSTLMNFKYGGNVLLALHLLASVSFSGLVIINCQIKTPTKIPAIQ